MKSEKKSFVFYFEWLEIFAELSSEEQGRLFMVICEYARTGFDNSNQLDKSLQMVFKLMRGQIDRDKEKYNKRCTASRGNGKKGGRPPKAASVELLADEFAAELAELAAENAGGQS